jgi:RNA polymerase sigma-70 factor (ECF subfamily)
MPPIATTSDVDLVDMARAGDRFAFDRLLLRHDERMRALAYRLLVDAEAMDAALRRAYVTAFEQLPKVPPTSDFGRWLYRTTYNACVDEMRRRKGQPIGPVAGPQGNVTTAEVVRQALAELPAAQRVTVVLVDGEGFEVDAVADILGVAAETVASRLYRARTRLRRILWDEIR